MRTVNDKVAAAIIQQQQRRFFDTVESSPLTSEQARAVVTYDNRVNVIAAAGLGKTSVMVARAAYAVSRGLVKPEGTYSSPSTRTAPPRFADRGETADFHASGRGLHRAVGSRSLGPGPTRDGLPRDGRHHGQERGRALGRELPLPPRRQLRVRTPLPARHRRRRAPAVPPRLLLPRHRRLARALGPRRERQPPPRVDRLPRRYGVEAPAASAARHDPGGDHVGRGHAG
ncbi:UvrD-helicase domain-containing protein [Serinicoccus sp. CUA-874]|uniref:UvrD-helicase domain-containing protein n=1 Tax=Serinicoccus sp. CUA-874 TaxID=1517939 RepID=UPI00096A7FE5